MKHLLIIAALLSSTLSCVAQPCQEPPEEFAKYLMGGMSIADVHNGRGPYNCTFQSSEEIDAYYEVVTAELKRRME